MDIKWDLKVPTLRVMVTLQIFDELAGNTVDIPIMQKLVKDAGEKICLLQNKQYYMMKFKEEWAAWPTFGCVEDLKDLVEADGQYDFGDDSPDKNFMYIYNRYIAAEDKSGGMWLAFNDYFLAEIIHRVPELEHAIAALQTNITLYKNELVILKKVLDMDIKEVERNYFLDEVMTLGIDLTCMKV